MVQYYYDKYTAVATNVFRDSAPWKLSGETTVVFGNWNTSYDFFSSNSYSPGGVKFTGTVLPGSVAYAAAGTYVERYTSLGSGVANSSVMSQVHTKMASENGVTTTYSRGSLMQSNIPAEDGTYPANGRHTDGNWYVKGAAVGPLPPGTVINQPYSTAGNGGRKLVRLKDGTLVACVLGQVIGAWYLLIYKSTDNGNTWTFLGKNGGWSLLASASWAITTNGTNVFVLLTVNTNFVQFKELRISEMSGGDWNIGTTDYGKYARLDDAQSALGGVSLAIDPTTGHLHAAWASKNASYPNSFNIRYAKSADGGLTWSAVEQITRENDGNKQHINPSIVIKSGTVSIIVERTDLVNSSISRLYYDGSTWRNTQVYLTSKSYTQSNPSAVVDKDGVIHVAWHGMESGKSLGVYYSSSNDGGITWSTRLRITEGISYDHVFPSITTDKTGDIYVLFEGGVTSNVDRKIKQLRKRNGVWGSVKIIADSDIYYGGNASTLYDATFSGQFGDSPPTVYMTKTTVEYIGTYTINSNPTISLVSPTNNQTLYENDTINISGDAYDADKDQSVTVYYQINNEARKVLATNLSQTQISLSKQLTFKGGKIYDGETGLTGTLADGVAHTLKVWAEDSEKASSAIVERTFYVVPNRAPLLTVDAVAPSGVVDADKFKINGTASDQDANSSVKVSRRINAENAVEIYSGPGGAWEFDLALSQLVVGQNTIVIEVVDNYGAKTSKTVTLNKKEVKTPILQSVARYKIEPPKGSAKGVLLFIQRDEELDMKVELSMTLNGEKEQYETLTPANTAAVQQGVVEDTFEYEGLETKQNIILKITPSRTDLSFNHKIHLISGAVD